MVFLALREERDAQNGDEYRQENSQFFHNLKHLKTNGKNIKYFVTMARFRYFYIFAVY
jgi:hypothetical protein